MAQRGRPGLSPRQKKQLWRRWRRGQSLSEIGRALGKHAGSIYGVLAAAGGITPSPRTRSDIVLSTREREEISRCLVRGLSIRGIASRLHRSPSTISREILRNSGRSRYRAARADDHAWKKAKRPKVPLLVKRSALRRVVATKLLDDWSPEQIAGWLNAKYRRGSAMRISHETITGPFTFRRGGHSTGSSSNDYEPSGACDAVKGAAPMGKGAARSSMLFLFVRDPLKSPRARNLDTGRAISSLGAGTRT